MHIHIPYKTIERKGEWNTKMMLNGKENPAAIELSDTYFETSKTNKNTVTQNSAAFKWTASTIPKRVAIPFPPRNPANIGNK